ncbi:hypothetical protein RSJ21_16175 [Clostridium botulinum]|uniref:hypothetical protein n=1 Tax=Clostridium botulinum TaxID=1491 RepID=UPI000A16FD06|nr:hypothetical protein [Clostridium botulinum]AUN12016.1 hypothetical protein RSJ6_16510 [Clostridium botulinum]AUN22959.1 hypothetical protein RSJ22_16550 [Clostridium botulinum]AUN26707.1 hypothetical protein RSJ21_16175 [Clostridium botulinum]OSA72033.1 hypothetical protein B2H87_08315 [Clostridium botulinum]QDY22465.1 hypothetical protein CGQ39_16370 [Clostridium botulinum]
MPLHKIPLCSFEYVGDNAFSSGIFIYDTTEKVVKTTEKLFYKETMGEIDKIKGDKLFYKEPKDNIEKEKNKYISKKITDIKKEFEKELELRNKEVNKNNTISLDKIKYISINRITSKELDVRKNTDISICYNNKLLVREILQLNKANNLINLSIDRENLQLNKFKSIYTDLIVEKEIFKGESLQNLKLEKYINIEKNIRYYLYRIYCKEIDIDKLKFVEKHGFKSINKNKYRFIDRSNLKEVAKISNKTMLNKDIIIGIDIDTSINNLKILNSKDIDKNYKVILMYNIALKDIEKYRIKNTLNKIAYKEICKDHNKKYFYKDVFKFIDKSINGYLDRQAIRSIFKYNNRYLDREYITNIFKHNEKYLDNSPIINIYKQIERDLLNLSIWQIYRQSNKYLNNEAIRQIYTPNKNKFIKITKRWWWLKPTNPTDRLIVPNKDYIYNNDLLNNLDYEYLRFSNHPIEWGKDWGVDYNIPPMEVSTEIMLDLINILAMIWHKNAQAWLSCTGKESIQFIMELIYDWYTVDTSSPSADYIRAYRWIRWEAEKVYFLNTENGLQAIGLLIANLIDYLKQHHFNLVPIWHNPKAMDIERKFNKVATNGDIMKDLDKLKDKRNYMIEAQNFEKKNIFGR